jgi:hypothetical protein
MAEHAWCRDIPRDEAVRAAKDGRPGPLPTLEECIEHVTERRPVPPGGGGNVTGLRTELVTLEVTHNNPWDINHWAWDYILRLGKRESVRVVEEVHFDDLAQVSMERDAAIREREAAKSDAEKSAVRIKSQAENVIYFRAERDEARAQRNAAIDERESLRARVAELERAYTAECDALAQAHRELSDLAEAVRKRESGEECDHSYAAQCREAAAARDRADRMMPAPAASEWRILKVGEEVEAADEMTDNLFMPWRDAGPCVGKEVASGPVYFRRRVPAPAASVNSQAILDGSPAASNSSAILTSSPAASGAALDPVLRKARLRDESRTEAYVASLDDASGAAGTEPVAWRYKGEPWFDGSRWHDKYELTADERLAKWKDKDALPLYAAPQPAKGWLTAEEREAVEYFSEFCDTNIVPDEWSEMSEKLRALLARSSPPEVVLPAPPFDPSNVAYSDWMMCLSAVRSYLAAAGVTVKEVGSE